MRIIYLCPADDTPTGGIKVIYRHAELLAELGVETYVLHPTDLDFSCTWFSHRVPLLRSLALNPENDFVIIPEIWAASFAPQCIDTRVKFAIFVQNPYLIPDQPPELFKQAYQAADLLLLISEDTERMVALNYPQVDRARMVHVRYSIHERFLARRKAEADAMAAPCISFMPRKMAYHSKLVVSALREHLPPRWRIQSIHNMDEATVAERLTSSSIFLSFSEFEGLPLPPIEAAIAGNLVIGYTGQGAVEYWEAPNFQEIHQGDIRSFVLAVRQAAQDIDAMRLTRADLAPGIDRLAARFSPAAELENLRLLSLRFRSAWENGKSYETAEARVLENSAL